MDADPTLEKCLICLGRGAVSSGFGDYEIESANDGFSFCCGRESFPGTIDLGRIEPEVLGNNATISNGHGSLLLVSF
jgi:hypothetical protein